MPHHCTSTKPSSHPLLPYIPPILSLQVQHTTAPFPFQTRHLELRGQALLLYKPTTAPYAPATAEKLLLLRHDTNPRPTGPKSAALTPVCPLGAPPTLHPAHRLRFPTADARDDFLVKTRLAIAHAETSVHRYSVLREIGSGAEGVVYLVRRRADSKLFAMKTVSKLDIFTSAPRQANLIAERVALAEAVARNSAFIVRLVDAFETKDKFCFVTEFASYGDLRNILRRMPEKRVPENVARLFFAEMAMAVESVHRMGYLYRDLKPGNLLMLRTGHLRLADLGLVKRVDIAKEFELLSRVSNAEEDGMSIIEDGFRLVGKAQSFVGTKRYMSPEIVGVSREYGYGAAADLWALGVTLYLMLVGDYPFGRDAKTERRANAIFEAIETETITYPDWLGADVRDLLRGLLERDAELRFGISEVREHPWLASIDLKRLREDSTKDVPLQEVLDTLNQVGFKAVEDVVGEDGGGLASEHVFTDLGAGAAEWKRRGKCPNGGMQLVGFGYYEVEGKRNSV